MSGAVSVGVAAIAIGGAIATEGATFAVIAAVGATVGAIGAVTHVRELQYAGAAIGVVGAVGGLASAAGAFGTGGVFGSGGSVFGGAGDAAGAAGSVASEGNISGFAAGGGPAGPSGGSLAAPGGIDAEISQWSGYGAQQAAQGGYINSIASAAEPSTNVGAAVTSPTVPEAASPPSTESPLVSGGGVTGAPPPTGTPMVSQAPAAPAVPEVPGAGQVTGTPTTGTPAPPGSQPTPLEKLMGDPTAGTSVGSNSVWTKILDFAKNNDKLLSGVIQAGSSFLSGATNPLTPAQISAMSAQAKANQAAANKYQAETAILQQQGANMNAPMPIASRITGTPVGMMNRGVTGVPA